MISRRIWRIFICLAATTLACEDVIGIQDPQVVGGDAGASDGKKLDAQVCTMQPCDLAPQCGCPAMEACDWNNGSRYCRTEGSGSDNATCTMNAQCAAGYGCINTNGAGHCLQYCSANSDCGSPRGECVVQIIDGSGSAIPNDVVCSSNCDPLSTTNVTCPSGWACDLYIFSYMAGSYDVTFCRPPGANGDGQSCLSGSGYCVPGDTCVSFGAGSAVCEHVCVISSGAGCPGGKTCHNFNNHLTVAGVEYGYCM